MKTLLLILVTACSALAQLQHVRSGTNLVLHWPEPAYCIALESWDGKSSQGFVLKEERYLTCAETHSFTVPIADPMEVFRVRVIDNGRIQTPYANFAFVGPTNRVLLNTALLFHCDDSPVGIRKIYHGQTTGSSNLLTSLTNSVNHYTYPASGTNFYWFQASDGVNDSWVAGPVTAVVP